MTTNQTIDGVPRELLETLVSIHPSDTRYRLAKEELRALLDAPDSVESLVGRTGGGTVWHECSACRVKGSYHPDVKWCVCGRPFDKPAAQPQGEPVAYRWRVKGHGEWTASVCKVEFDARANDDRFVSQALYAEQLAPVAVVLPEQLIAAIEAEQERLSQEDYLMDSEDCVKVIREEVTRLNTK